MLSACLHITQLRKEAVTQHAILRTPYHQMATAGRLTPSSHSCLQQVYQRKRCLLTNHPPTSRRACEVLPRSSVNPKMKGMGPGRGHLPKERVWSGGSHNLLATGYQAAIRSLHAIYAHNFAPHETLQNETGMQCGTSKITTKHTFSTLMPLNHQHNLVYHIPHTTRDKATRDEQGPKFTCSLACYMSKHHQYRTTCDMPICQQHNKTRATIRQRCNACR